MKFTGFLAVSTLLACASCQLMGTDSEPPVVRTSQKPVDTPRPVDAEVDRWFRGLTPSTGVRLTAGDRIRIEVQGQPDLTVTRDVPLDGNVPIYRTDTTVKVLDKTPQELESEIAKAYAKAFTEPPYVTVTILSAAPRTIYVVGAVKNPGPFLVSGYDQLTVLKALTMAGGFLPQSDLSGVTVQRIHPVRGVTVASPALDIRKVIEKGDQRDNLVVAPGDTIVVPGLQESTVQVLGHVEKPGSVAWHKGMRLSEAITEAGGFKRFPKLSRIKIVHHGMETTEVNFEDVLAVPPRAADPELDPYDMVYVDERWL